MRGIVGFAAFVIVIAGMKSAAQIINPLLMALLVAMVAWPPMHWLQRRKVPEVISLVIVMGSILLAATAIGGVVAASLRSFQTQLPAYQANLQGIVNSLINDLASRGVATDVDSMRSLINPGAIMGYAANALNSLGGVVANFLLVLLLSIFLLLELDALPQRLRNLGESTAEFADQFDIVTAKVNSYLAVKAMVSALTGIIVAGGLWLTGVNHPVLWGMVAFLLNFVPNIGSIIAALPPALLALIQLGVPGVVAVAVLYTAVNMLIGNVIEPQVVGAKMGISSLVVFVSLVFWGWVLGPVGMFLSVPLTMVIKVWLENDERSAWLGALLGDSAVSVGDEVS